MHVSAERPTCQQAGKSAEQRARVEGGFIVATYMRFYAALHLGAMSMHMQRPPRAVS